MDGKDNKYHELIRTFSFWVSVIGAFCLGVVLAVFYIVELFKDDSWIIEIHKAHFVASVGLPFAAIAAVFVVIIFKHQDGPIELKVPGFEFKGAAGQIIMWVIVFFSEAIALKMLW